jgi:hypothetical protein
VLQNFVDAILDGEPLLAPARDGAGAVELANAILWSAMRHEPVALPIDAAGYETHLQQLIASSRFKKQTTRKEHDEVAPYLVKEK